MDCQNHSVNSSGFAVWIEENEKNITVQNCNFYKGMQIDGSSGSKIYNITLRNITLDLGGANREYI